MNRRTFSFTLPKLAPGAEPFSLYLHADIAVDVVAAEGDTLTGDPETLSESVLGHKLKAFEPIQFLPTKIDGKMTWLML